MYKTNPSTIDKYIILNDIYITLRKKDFSISSTLNYIAKCGVLTPNKEALKPKIRLTHLRQCLREAK